MFVVQHHGNRKQKIWATILHIERLGHKNNININSWILFIMSGFDINGCPIAQGKWNVSLGKWKRHPTCPIRQVKMFLWYVQFLKSKMINIELFSVGSRGKFYLNIASYASCLLRHFVLFCWLRNSPFSNKDHVIYISHSWMPN